MRVLFLLMSYILQAGLGPGMPRSVRINCNAGARLCIVYMNACTISLYIYVFVGICRLGIVSMEYTYIIMMQHNSVHIMTMGISTNMMS